MEEKNDYTDAVSDNRNGQEIEVGIAGAGDRILAALLNQLFTFLILLVPFVGLIAFAVKNEGRIGGREEIFGLLLGMTSFWVGLAGILAYTVIQIYYMSRDGQSLGKKIMRIRVLKTDGRNPGFVGTVLVREIAWSVLVAIIAGLAVGENGENAINLLAFLANFVLLFMVKRDRRTLYDILADTVVVKLPK
ncbi:TPA: RDD family protein [Neisseria gonorrhoeae]